MNRKPISIFLAALTCLLLFASCSKEEHRSIIDANVLLIWPMDESEPAYEKWTEAVIDELHRQGIRGHVEVHYSQLTKRYEYEERELRGDLLNNLRTEGKMPDLILSYGMQNYWMVLTDVFSLAKTVPAVCFGMSSEKFLPYQYDMLQDSYKGGRDNIVTVLNKPHLKENLDLADSLSSSIIDYIYRPDYYFITKNRFITMLDVDLLWADRITYHQLIDQMEEMDSSRYYSNLEAKVSESQLIKYATKDDRIVFSCRSVMSPTWNISEGNNQIATTWAFYPQKGPNLFIQGKHDYKSKELAEGPSNMMYFTMVPEDYLFNSKCIGGYFASYEEQIRDAVSAGVRLLKGETADEIGIIESRPSYFINWDVVRPLGLDVNLVPDFVNVDNATLKDRNPLKHKHIERSIWALFAMLLVWSTAIVALLSSKFKANSRRIRQYSNEIISNYETLEQMQKIADIKTWEMLGEDHDFGRISASDFFMRKIVDFVKISVPGIYEQRFFCSIDNKDPHWYELRMTVNEKDGRIEKKGVLINIDYQKELESIAAETNRIIQSVRTREGFIASINHQIRTPLNSIVGYSQLLAEPDIPTSEEELHEYRLAIDNNSFLLKHTINNILTATMLGKSNITPQMEIIRLNDFIGPESNFGKDIIDKNQMQLVPGPVDLDVRADATLLTRVLENLLINASNFSSGSEPILMGWRECKEDGYSAEIWVQDNGIGIKPEYHNLIFDKFFKADSFTAGCGLGLYICKSFTELMGGKITCESIVGEGSTFKLKLSC
ncbi:MAG: HAMP domain-containing histidine kinase [Rikenellaceae bacterium]|nr:HAMP domain-containing histidine kinase [Rikenellaceae bacterium]